MAYTKSEATVAGILSAAQALFLAKNYGDVTMDDIASAADVTKGALYHHFATKEALYVAMMTTALHEKQALFKAAADIQGSCRERLRRVTATFLELPRERRDVMKLVRRDNNIFGGRVREQLVRAYQAALPHNLEPIIRDGICNGELAQADPRLLSWLYVAMVEVILTRYAEKVFTSPDETANFVTDLFFEGAGKS
jgi:AcrR family transcriptional regulator